MTDYTQTSTEALLKKADDCIADVSNRLFELCEILLFLEKRKVAHRAHKAPSFKFYKEVARGQLTPELFAAFAGRPDILKAAVGRSKVIQESILNHEEFVIAKLSKTKITADRTKGTALSMTEAELSRVFPKGQKGTNSFEKQKELLLKNREPKVVPHGPKLVTFETRDAVGIGEYTVPVADLIPHLNALGYEVRKND